MLPLGPALTPLLTAVSSSHTWNGACAAKLEDKPFDDDGNSMDWSPWRWNDESTPFDEARAALATDFLPQRLPLKRLPVNAVPVVGQLIPPLLSHLVKGLPVEHACWYGPFKMCARANPRRF